MRKLKKAMSLLLAALLCASVLVGCADGGDGVSLSVSVGSRVTTLDPIYAEDINSQTVLVHLYENLMKVAPDGAGGAAAARLRRDREAGAVSRGDEGQGDPAPAAGCGHHPVSAAVPRQQDPQRAGGHVYGRAGAVPQQPDPAGRSR